MANKGIVEIKTENCYTEDHIRVTVICYIDYQTKKNDNNCYTINKNLNEKLNNIIRQIISNQSVHDIIGKNGKNEIDSSVSEILTSDSDYYKFKIEKISTKVLVLSP